MSTTHTPNTNTYEGPFYITSSDTGRDYWIDENGIAHRDYQSEAFAAEAAAERHAEFAMNWVMGGGDPADTGAAWAMHRDSWNGVELV
jgi:hypothetical protein